MGAFLEGNKTYVVALMLLVAGVLYKLQLLDFDTLALVVLVLNGGGLASLRQGMKAETTKTVNRTANQVADLVATQPSPIIVVEEKRP